MFKCTGCGKEFSTSQGLGSHRRFGCGDSSSLVVRQAREIVNKKMVGQTSDLRPQVSDLRPEPLNLASFPDLRYRPQTSADLDLDDIKDYKARVSNIRTLAKLREEEQYASRAPWRKMAILMVIGGVFLYFWAGGKLKLPFFGSVD